MILSKFQTCIGEILLIILNKKFEQKYRRSFCFLSEDFKK